MTEFSMEDIMKMSDADFAKYWEDGSIQTSCLAELDRLSPNEHGEQHED